MTRRPAFFVRASTATSSAQQESIYGTLLNKETLVSFGNCIECGACDVGCPYDNIGCHSPRGGYGVQSTFG